ncbi:hypothetical protein MTBBW1_2660003 [Desulfamplus magnetovallimortis]|uniref:Uncharacterized protein n=1 Tax=Desulfamplus magnetovallimortis TaxID=1246637 RepID=A0A1W1HF24_9BACT|nr:hypothetical protein [Desulfamplus magnetovallimortis]SLM31070.1 hypothetical protein MTBBW1_2660003 [Desulfamplus magnetovallimortis]
MKSKQYKAQITILDSEQKIVTDLEHLLSIENGTIDDIEMSIKELKNIILTEIQKSILENEQTEYIKKSLLESHVMERTLSQ